MMGEDFFVEGLDLISGLLPSRAAAQLSSSGLGTRGFADDLGRVPNPSTQL